MDKKLQAKYLPDYKDASASTVIPAWMPETRAMEGNLLITLPHDLGSGACYSFTSLYLDSGIHAGMTYTLELAEASC